MRKKYKHTKRGFFKINAGNKTIKKLTRIFLLIFACFILLFGIFYGVVYFTTHSKYFNVRQVEIKNDFSLSNKEAIEFCQLSENSNIFLVDLNKLKQKLLKIHPEFKQVIITRILPDKLEINIKERKPVAQIKLAGYFLVDNTCFILPKIKNFPEPDLPIIQGIDISLNRLKIGEVYRNENLKQAIVLIQTIPDYPELKKQKLVLIDVSDINNIYFILNNNVKIKLGDKIYNKRLKILNEIVSNLGYSFNQLDSIDLRFGDPIIVPK